MQVMAATQAGFVFIGRAVCSTVGVFHSKWPGFLRPACRGVGRQPENGLPRGAKTNDEAGTGSTRHVPAKLDVFPPLYLACPSVLLGLPFAALEPF